MRERRPATPPGQPSHPELRILLLGPPVVLWHDCPLTPGRRQSRAVLFRVAAAVQPVPRDHLCFLLWPDAPDHAARRNLTNVLTHLKRALPLPDVLLADRDTIRLDTSITYSDVQAFAGTTTAARTDGSSAHLQTAIDLYRGAFLDGFSLPACPEFEAWRHAERNAWERRYLQALATVVETEATAGNVNVAIASAIRYLEVEPLAEAMQRRLMALYAGRGDRDTALAQFARCAEVLQRELGVDPMPETRALYTAIRDGHSPLYDTMAGLGRDEIALYRRSRASDRVPVRGTLPASLTPLIGRAGEVRSACERLVTDAVRWLTLTGPGGVGKTRLAIEVGHALGTQYADGVIWVPLAPLRDPALLADAILQACGLAQSGQAPREQLCAFVRDKHLLLVLDNLEHLLSAVSLLSELLAAAPRLQLLVTSRMLPNGQSQHVLPVPPLPLPDLDRLPPPDILAQQPAVALLLARIHQHQPGFQLTTATAADLAALCVRLDGLPLALELAAARLRLMSPQTLLRRLDRRLALLGGGPRDVPARQRTLWATIDWSYQLLSEEQGHLLECLAVFAGGWTLEAVEALTRSVRSGPRNLLDGLQVLLDAHLIRQHTGADGAPRFSMLETIREYAAERLAERGLAVEYVRAHAQYYCALVEQIAPELYGSEQARRLARLGGDDANILAALKTLYEQREYARGLSMASRLERFWLARGSAHIGRHWLSRLLTAQRASDVPDAPAHIVSRALEAACSLATYQNDYQEARVLVEAAVMLRRSGSGRRELVRVLLQLGMVCRWLGDRAAAAQAFHEAADLAEPLAVPEVTAELARDNALTAVQRGAMQEARAAFERSLAVWRSCGDVLMEFEDLSDLANVNLALNDVASAQQHASAAFRIAEELDSRAARVEALFTLGEIARYQRDLARAETYYRECAELAKRTGKRDMTAYALGNLGCVALDRGKVALARASLRASFDCFQQIGAHSALPELVAVLGRVATVEGRPLQAARLWGAAEAQLEKSKQVLLPIDQTEHDRYEAMARSVCPHESFAAAWSAGRGVSIERALAEEMGCAAEAPPAAGVAD